MMFLAGLLPPAVAFAEMHLSELPDPLLGSEPEMIEGASARRKVEFTAGRSCARRALALLGRPAEPIPAAADRLPIWPPGITGSISHSQSHCVAAVAFKTSTVQTLGIDIEQADAVDLDLADAICTRTERDWLVRQSAGMRQRLLTGIFSAKESVFKAQYHLSRALFGFDTIHLDLAFEHGVFSARFERDVLPFNSGYVTSGRIAFRRGHVVTAVTIPPSSYLGGKASCVTSRENSLISGTTA
jgi:4'-phosphopantetheinyl transferase EntD